jgi:diguanylate cyclase (GGDEF)-like protein
MIDVDHFKYVNDKFGHICGDAFLHEAAARMKKSVPPYDTVGRYGGEEFLIVVPASDAVGVLGLAERIRKTIESVPVATDSDDVRITASLGVAVSSSTRRFDPESLPRLADDALYRAKEHSRNRSELAATPPEDDSVPAESNSAVLPTGSR